MLVLFQPHLYSRTRHLAAELGAALVGADAVCVTEVYPRARSRSTASTASSSSTRSRPAVRAGWAPSVEDGARVVAAWARPGDLVLTIGAGDVDRAGPLLLEELR